MGAAEKFDLVGVEDYLAGEQSSAVKHEYTEGRVYALADEHGRHDAITAKIVASFRKRLGGRTSVSCHSAARTRLRFPTQVCVYYPDVSIARCANAPDGMLHDDAVIIAEVLSKRTRRTDQIEKRDAYLRIPSLDAYLIVQQENPAIPVYRRTSEGFEREVHSGMDAVIPLPTIEAELPLAEAYESMEFGPEPGSEGH